LSSPKLRPDDSLTILSDGFVSQLHPRCFLHECDSSYEVLTSTPAGLTPAEQASLCWTHSLANSQLARISAFFEFDTMPHARRSHPFRSFDRHLKETCKTGRRPIDCCRVCPRKASTADFESIAETITEFTCIGSNHRRFVRTADASRTRCPLCNRAQTVNSSSFPRCSGETKVWLDDLPTKGFPQIFTFVAESSAPV
jgi:hypothetical protein